jgi:hypothetical protein
VLALIAAQTQRGYYKATRQTKQRLQDCFQLSGYELAPTPGMGSGLGRLLRVTTAQNGMMIVMGLAGAAGFVGTVFPSTRRDTRKVTLAIRMAPSSTVASTPRELLVVSQASRDGHSVLRTIALREGETASFTLSPGAYRVSAVGTRLCERDLELSAEHPVVLRTLACP